MSKAILVINIPNEYPLEELKANVLITHKGNWLCKRHRKKLKELPKKLKGNDNDNWHKIDFKEGWNDCLDEIMGED